MLAFLIVQQRRIIGWLDSNTWAPRTRHAPNGTCAWAHATFCRRPNAMRNIKGQSRWCSPSPIQIWPSCCFFVPSAARVRSNTRCARNEKAARGSDLNRTSVHHVCKAVSMVKGINIIEHNKQTWVSAGYDHWNYGKAFGLSWNYTRSEPDLR